LPVYNLKFKRASIPLINLLYSSLIYEKNGPSMHLGTEIEVPNESIFFKQTQAIQHSSSPDFFSDSEAVAKK